VRVLHRTYYKIIQRLAAKMDAAVLPGKNYPSRIRKG
jgi:hypothetical protein